MVSKKELVSPCGLYCGVCGVYIAHKGNDMKFSKTLAKSYGLYVQDIRCKSCHSDELFIYCQACPIRLCVTDKGIEGCHQCNDFPCVFVETFPLHYGRRVILRTIPARNAIGIDKWVEEEEQRYHCPYCGYKTYMGAEECWSCKEPIDLD